MCRQTIVLRASVGSYSCSIVACAPSVLPQVPACNGKQGGTMRIDTRNPPFDGNVRPPVPPAPPYSFRLGCQALHAIRIFRTAILALTPTLDARATAAGSRADRAGSPLTDLEPTTLPCRPKGAKNRSPCLVAVEPLPSVRWSQSASTPASRWVFF